MSENTPEFQPENAPGDASGDAPQAQPESQTQPESALETQLAGQPQDAPANPVASADPGAAATPGHTAPEDLVVYAMQFLTGDEAAAVAAHLATCEDCRQELARIHTDLAAYAFTAEMQPVPASLRQRLLAQIALDNNDAPLAPAAKPVPPAQPRLVPAQTTAQAPQTPQADQPTLAAFNRNASILTSSNDDEPPKRNVGLAILGWSGWAIAAGLAVTTTGLYRERVSLRTTLASRAGQVQRLSVAAASARQLSDALTDPGAVRATLTAKPQTKAVPIAGVTYNPTKGTLIFLASNLEPLQLYKVYELWVIPADGSDPLPAGTFHPDQQGNASLIMPELPKGVPAKAFGVTVEDEGGSPTPTLPIVMAGS